MEGIFALAEEAGVPILIHAGRGMPPIADGLAELALRHPEVVLILAHGAICDQGLLVSRLADHPGVLYDSSCFFPLDVIALLARVPAERVVFASDPPYGLPAAGLYFTLRLAAHAGLDERATRAILGETMAAVVDGSPLPRAHPPRGAGEVVLGARVARVYGYGSLAGPALFAGAREQAQGMLDLAISVCRDPDPGPEGPALDQIGAALLAARALLDAKGGSSAAIDLLYRSMALAATEPLSARGSATERPTRRARAASAHVG
jgi:hypothetical protein